MTRITIKCPITWHEQCQWIEDHCKNYTDKTEWAAWNIGFDDIYYDLEDSDAIMFILRFS